MGKRILLLATGGTIASQPTEEGLEARYKARLEQIRTWKQEHETKPEP